MILAWFHYTKDSSLLSASFLLKSSFLLSPARIPPRPSSSPRQFSFFENFPQRRGCCFWGPSISPSQTVHLRHLRSMHDCHSYVFLYDFPLRHPPPLARLEHTDQSRKKETCSGIPQPKSSCEVVCFGFFFFFFLFPFCCCFFFFFLVFFFVVMFLVVCDEYYHSPTFLDNDYQKEMYPSFLPPPPQSFFLAIFPTHIEISLTPFPLSLIA